MAKYKLLIIDDDLKVRQPLYEVVFNDGKYIEVDYAGTLEDLEKIDSEAYHGYIVDIFLDKFKAGIKVQDILKRIGKKGPIFLISSEWIRVGDIQLMQILNETTQWNVAYFISLNEIANYYKGETEDEQINTFRWKLNLELNKHYSRSDFNPNSNDDIILLHLSDLQFGDPNEDKEVFLAAKNITQRLQADNIRPNFLILTGDISYSGAPDEYNEATKWLNKFIKMLWPDKSMNERILLTPGNHDVNLKISALDKYKYDAVAKIA